MRAQLIKSTRDMVTSDKQGRRSTEMAQHRALLAANSNDETSVVVKDLT